MLELFTHVIQRSSPLGIEGSKAWIRRLWRRRHRHVAALGLAIERAFGIQYAYAVDGSRDEVEAWGEGATGERAAALGAWDGVTAYGERSRRGQATRRPNYMPSNESSRVTDGATESFSCATAKRRSRRWKVPGKVAGWAARLIPA